MRNWSLRKVSLYLEFLTGLAFESASKSLPTTDCEPHVSKTDANHKQGVLSSSQNSEHQYSPLAYSFHHKPSFQATYFFKEFFVSRFVSRF